MKREWKLGWQRKSAMASLILLSGTAIGVSDAADRSAEKDLQVTVPRAVCGPGDHPETALQGQVPANLRASGFQGFNCNLRLVSQSKGDGAN